MKKAVIALGAVFLVTGCNSGPSARNHIITADEASGTKLFDDISECRDLTVGEVRMLVAYSMLAGMANSFKGDKDAAVFPVGKTVGEVLEMAKEFQKQQAEKQSKEEALKNKILAENAQIISQLKSCLTGTIVSKQFQKADYEHGVSSDSVLIKLAFENTGKKPIKAFKGRFVCSTELGDEIRTINYTGDDLPDPLQPKALMDSSGSLDFNQFMNDHVKFRDTSLKSMKVEFVPTVILFTDGSKLEVSE